MEQREREILFYHRFKASHFVCVLNNKNVLMHFDTCHVLFYSLCHRL